MNEKDLYNRLYKDHHQAWDKTDYIKKCGDKKKELLELWQNELCPHFEEEEDVLFPLLVKKGKRAEVKELLREHEYFYNLINKIDETIDCNKYVDDFCLNLKNHIKNEEKIMGCFHDDPYCKPKNKKMKNNIDFEPLVSDSDFLSDIEERLSNRKINTMVQQRTLDVTDDEFSNFSVFGIGKRTKKQQERKDKRKAKSKVRKAGRKERRAEAKEERKGKTFFGRVFHGLQKYNPALAVVRTGVIAGLRVNIFGLSRRLYPALLSEQELKSRNFNLENAKRTKDALKKAHDIYFRIGGRSATFDHAIKQGYDKPVFKTKKMKQMKQMEKKSSFASDKMNHQLWSVYPSATSPYYYSTNQHNGSGISFEPNSKLELLDDDVYYGIEPVSTGSAIVIMSGLSALGAIAKAISGKTNANPYEQGSPEYEKYQKGLSDAEAEGDLESDYDEQEFQEMEKLAQEEKEEYGDEVGELDSAKLSDDKILGIPKTGFYIGAAFLGIALIGTTIYFTTRKK